MPRTAWLSFVHGAQPLHEQQALQKMIYLHLEGGTKALLRTGLQVSERAFMVQREARHVRVVGFKVPLLGFKAPSVACDDVCEWISLRPEKLK